MKAESDDDEFEVRATKKPRTSNGKPPKKKFKEESDDYDASSDDDKPIAPKKPTASRKRKVKVESEPEASSDDNKPISKPPPKPQAKKVKKVKKEENAPDSNTSKPKKRATKANEEASGTPVKGKGRKKEKKEEEEQEEIFRWWEADANGDGTVKWQTLEHNGVIFPPPYEPLPSHVKMKYDGITTFFWKPCSVF